MLSILNYKLNKRWNKRHKKLAPRPCPKCNKERPLTIDANGNPICSACLLKSYE